MEAVHLADWGERDPRWEGVRSEPIQVNGHAVTLLRHDSTGGDLPQLMVHGLGGSARNWLDVMAPLSVHGPVVAVDLPGFGETEPHPGGSARVTANAGFLAALMRSLGWDRAVVYGNSMGGTIVTLFAARHPQMIDRLVLVNPALPAPKRQQLGLVTRRRAQQRVLLAGIPGVGAAAIRAGFRYRTADRLVDDTVRGVYADPSVVRPSVRQLYIESVERTKVLPWRQRGLAQAAVSLIHLLAGARTLYRAIDAITTDALVVWGDQDALVSRPVIDALHARQPGWDLHVFPAVGHAPMLEAPDTFVEVVSEWLKTDRVESPEAVPV